MDAPEEQDLAARYPSCERRVLLDEDRQAARRQGAGKIETGLGAILQRDTAEPLGDRGAGSVVTALELCDNLVEGNSPVGRCNRAGADEEDQANECESCNAAQPLEALAKPLMDEWHLEESVAESRTSP